MKILLLYLLLIVHCWRSSADVSLGDDKGKIMDKQCVQLAQSFIRNHGKHPSENPIPSEMLYFLHIPRTAGRTFYSCFLKLAYAPSKRCARSYDILRLNESMSECGLLSSHDDYSIIDNLPGNSAISTQLRDPVDRVLSAYEFALEVAARSINGTEKQKKPSEDKTSTQDVWPWSFLVPFLEEDLQKRHPKLTKAAGELANYRGTNSYENGPVMPLEEFLKHPGVENVLYNGATLQVLGLTDYSQWTEANNLRACQVHSKQAQSLLQELALERLEKFAHVGIFERLEESIGSLASYLGIDLDGPSYEGNSLDTIGLKKKDPEWLKTRFASLEAGMLKNRKELDNLLNNKTLDSETSGGGKHAKQVWRLQKKLANSQHESSVIESLLNKRGEIQYQPSWDKAYENLYPLWRGYHYCVDNARTRNARRKSSSLKRLDVPGKKVRFSSSDRNLMKTERPDLIKFIREKNQMDVALYEKGQILLDKAIEAQKQQGKFKPLRPAKEANIVEIGNFEKSMKSQGNRARHTRNTGDTKEGLSQNTQGLKPEASHEELR